MFGSRKKQPPEIQFDEKEVVMGVLANDPRIMSHVWGQEIYRLQQTNRKGAAERTDQLLRDLSDRYAQDPETLCRVLRTMMVIYDVEVSSRLPAIPLLHGLIDDYVCQNHASIEVYQ